jgi:hypothetical protein
MLANCGRSVSLTTLSNWRKNGLLPQFSSQGLGLGKGRNYYWSETDIADRACAIYDLLEYRTRNDPVILALWFLGFKVSLPQLRRAWLHHARARESWSTSTACSSEGNGQTPRVDVGPLAVRSEPGTAPSLLFMRGVLAACMTLVRPESERVELILEIVARAIAKTTQRNHTPLFGDRTVRGRIAVLLTVIGDALVTSDLLSVATDEEMQEAQRYWAVLQNLLLLCVEQADCPEVPAASVFLKTAWVSEHIGTPLFLLILLLLRSGHRHQLDRTFAELGDISARSEEPLCAAGNSPGDSKFLDVMAAWHRIMPIWEPVWH